MTTTQEWGERARAASKVLKTAGSEEKNEMLRRIAQALRTETDAILAANEVDLEAARKTGIRETMLDRLSLSEARIEGIAAAVEALIKLEDPIGEVIRGFTRPNGLEIRQVRVPLGTVGMIFEARPNVTVDAACLCLKTGNAVLLRGGKEAYRSNLALAECMRRAIRKAGGEEDAVCLVQDTSRNSVTDMMNMTGVLDVLIPRGGAGLIRAVKEGSKVPVIETGVGNCHIYVDEFANLEKAVSIVVNAKTSRPSVCNAAESLLVHEAVAEAFLPRLAGAMPAVTLHGCEKTRAILPSALPAAEEDYAKEYLDLEMSVKVVKDLSEATQHIANYSTGHSEAIVTENYTRAQRFVSEVDAAAVYVNASTRFTDGGEFGLGAEIGISTQKLHARGPMGLEALTSTKYIVFGSGQIRA